MIEILEALTKHLTAIAGLIVAVAAVVAAVGKLRDSWSKPRPKTARAPTDPAPDPDPAPAPPRSEPRPTGAGVPLWKIALRAALSYGALLLFSSVSDMAWNPFVQSTPGPVFYLFAGLTLAALLAVLYHTGWLILRGLRVAFSR